jgi:hypothetical protein
VRGERVQLIMSARRSEAEAGTLQEKRASLFWLLVAVARSPEQEELLHVVECARLETVEVHSSRKTWSGKGYIVLAGLS